MKKSNWFAWLKRFFGFGKKSEKVIVIDIETGGLESRPHVIFPTEGYKAEHKKHHEAMDKLLDKIERNKNKNVQSQGDDFEGKLDGLKEAYEKHYRREKVEVKKVEPKREIVIIEPAESIMPLIIGFDPSNEIIDETPINDSPIEFDGGFGGGGFSGGGGGSDYSSNSDYPSSSDYSSNSNYSSGSDYSSNSSYSSGSDYSTSSNYDDSSSRQDY